MGSHFQVFPLDFTPSKFPLDPPGWRSHNETLFRRIRGHYCVCFAFSGESPITLAFLSFFWFSRSSLAPAPHIPQQPFLENIDRSPLEILPAFLTDDSSLYPFALDFF